MKTIRWQLLSWLLSGMLAATVIAGISIFLKVRSETNILFDYQLRQTAVSFPALLRNELNLPIEDEPGEDMIVQGWDRHGTLVFTSRTQPRLPHFETSGFRTVFIDNVAWRIYDHPANAENDMLVQVAQPIQVRDELAAGIALHSILPFLALVPAQALLIWLVVGRSLAPVNRLTAALGTRSAQAMQELDDEGYPPELQPILAALNTLLAQLSHAMAAQRTFVADAAHELRTPLTALKLQLQLVERETDDAARIAGFRKLDNRINRATHLVEQLLTLARQEDVARASKATSVDLRALAAIIVSDFMPLAESRHIELTLDVRASACYVKGHFDTLRIMLGNLVDNALRHSTPNSDGKVQVVVGRADGRPELHVLDNGPGVPDNERLRIFDRFYRGERAGESGSGLGLAIARTIAEHHDATLLLRDPPAGSGLSIVVQFPVQEHGAAA